jgi:nucleoside-diphosphate-sugar epimerase
MSGNENYGNDAHNAGKNWKCGEGSSGRNGGFVFTSSAGVYKENEGGTISIDSEVKSGPNNILDAEKSVLDNGGTVLRFGGLYTSYRGAHNYWLGRDSVPSSPSGYINLIHYDDAATAIVSALELNLRKTVLLVSDGVPISRKDICLASVEHPTYSGKSAPNFTGNGTDGKKYDISEARRQLVEWAPKYISFAAFMKELHGLEDKFDLL